jgi:hypothetical protein
MLKQSVFQPALLLTVYTTEIFGGIWRNILDFAADSFTGLCSIAISGFLHHAC